MPKNTLNYQTKCKLTLYSKFWCQMSQRASSALFKAFLLNICKYALKRRICRKLANTRLTRIIAANLRQMRRFRTYLQSCYKNAKEKLSQSTLTFCKLKYKINLQLLGNPQLTCSTKDSSTLMYPPHCWNDAETHLREIKQPKSTSSTTLPK